MSSVSIVIRIALLRIMAHLATLEASAFGGVLLVVVILVLRLPIPLSEGLLAKVVPVASC